MKRAVKDPVKEAMATAKELAKKPNPSKKEIESIHADATKQEKVLKALLKPLWFMHDEKDKKSTRKRSVSSRKKKTL